MLKPNFVILAMMKLVLASCLVLLLSLLLPTALWAAPPIPAGAEKCAKCHTQETDAWQNSPHAKAGMPGATCEGCHGPYVEGHPEAGTMQLTVDSSICQDCHNSTYAQWQNSTHAQAGVQCIAGICRSP